MQYQEVMDFLTSVKFEKYYNILVKCGYTSIDALTELSWLEFADFIEMGFAERDIEPFAIVISDLCQKEQEQVTQGVTQGGTPGGISQGGTPGVTQEQEKGGVTPGVTQQKPIALTDKYSSNLMKKINNLSSIEREILQEIATQYGDTDKRELMKEKYPETCKFISTFHLEKYCYKFLEAGYTSISKIIKIDVPDLIKMEIPREEFKGILQNLVRAKIDKYDTKSRLFIYQMYEEAYVFLVGINQYKKENISKLAGCVNDVQAMKQMFDRKGYTTFEPLVNEKATKRGVEQSIDNIRITLHQTEYQKRNITANSLFIFYYSGHGFRIKDSADTVLNLYDVNDPCDITGNIKVSALITQLQLLGCKHVLIILDCCFAGNSVSEINIRQDSILINSFHRGVWLLSSTSKGELAREIPVNGKIRGNFSYHLEKLLTDYSEGIYGDEFQKYLKREHKDDVRNLNRIAYPQEIVSVLRRKLLNQKLTDHVPAASPLLGIGIPFLGCTIKDFIVYATRDVVNSAKKVAMAEIAELEFRKPQLIEQEDHVKIIWKIMKKYANLYDHTDCRGDLETINNFSEKRLVIFGNPGSGKTHTCELVLQKFYKNPLNKYRLLFYVNMIDCAQGGDYDVYEHVLRRYLKNHSTVPLEELERALIAAKDTVWLIDNYHYLCRPRLTTIEARLKQQISNSMQLPIVRIFSNPTPLLEGITLHIPDLTFSEVELMIKTKLGFKNLEIPELYRLADDTEKVYNLEVIIEHAREFDYLHNIGNLQVFLDLIKIHTPSEICEYIVNKNLAKNINKSYYIGLVKNVLRIIAKDIEIEESTLFLLISKLYKNQAADLFSAVLDSGFLQKRKNILSFIYKSFREYFL